VSQLLLVTQAGSVSPARERRFLLRSSDPLSEAAIKIAALKTALFAERDQGPDSEVRASGDCICEVCGDAYIDHLQTYPETCPSSVGICTGERFKL